MPNYFDKQKQRYRFTFKRVIDDKLYRFSKLLPSAWGQAEADAFDRKEIKTVIQLYGTHHVPTFRHL
jgi:hypothetical protein